MEDGVPVDMLVGTSMGSIVAGFYAAGYSVENIKQIVGTLDTGSLKHIALLPKGGFMDASRLQQYLDVLF